MSSRSRAIRRDLRLRTIGVAFGLVLLVAAVYAPVGGHAFVDFDDGEYVYANTEVLAGLRPAGVAWAFTTGYAANWFPLTWLSHMADVSLFGPAPGPHHVVNAAFHAANAVLLFLALNVLTGGLWRSAVVSALFAVHPLNVQSVAWVSERKNVLSTVFWLLAMLAYAAYARRPSRGRMAFVAALLALGLMCKPMLVTVPLVLLVLDFWPLGRFGRAECETGGANLERLRPLLVEKTPLFVLIALSSAVTWLVQRRGGATASVENFPLADRLANALLSYGQYLSDGVWPTSLSFFYPHPRNVGQPVNFGSAVLWGVALAAVTFFVWRAARPHPWALTGWSWFVVTLIPVIGIVQVGAQSHADRYAYVPLIGIFMIFAWGAFALTERLARRAAWGVMACAGLAVLALGVRARREVGYWRDGGTLYGRGLELDQTNWLAWNNLGTFRLSRNDVPAALSCFDSAAKIKPDFADAQYNRGVALQLLNRPLDALTAYERALRLDPGNADAWVNTGNANAAVGRLPDAITCFTRALGIRPDDAHALNGLVLAYDSAGDRRSAFAALERLRRVDPAMARELFVPNPAPR